MAMSKIKVKEEVQKALSPVNPMDAPAPFRLSEIGTSGLNIFQGISTEELKQELNFPNSIKTYKLMQYHPAINASTSLYNSMLSKVKFRVLPPKDATFGEKRKAEIISQMLFEDMEKPFEDFIQEAMTMSTFGFAVIEKVYRKRNKSSGSIFKDDLISPKKLSLRSQGSIQKFVFSEDGSEIIGVRQQITASNDPLGRYAAKGNGVVIPRNKFMLFTVGNTTDNPYGTSPLRNVYLPWKYISALEELEASGIQKDLSGVPVVRLPAQYMSSDATPEQKMIYEMFKNIVRNLQAGSQSGVILPSAVDAETRQKLFDLELLSVDGKRGFDINAVKEYYRSMIFIGLQADILLMGNTNSGSFALGSIKNTLTANTVEMYVKNIVKVINLDLIRQIYDLNSWDITRMCKLDYEGFEQESLDEIGKYLQRTAATGLMTKDLDTINFVRNTIGLDALPEGTDLTELLGDMTSKSGMGMSEGLNSGTGSADGSSGNSSDMNSDNAS